MANEVDVGGIVVRLIADAKQLEAALSKGSADMRKFGNETEKTHKQAVKAGEEMGKSIAGVVTRLGGLLAAYVSVSSAISAFNNAMANVTALDHLSQATGVGIERLSELRNIALATGIDFETLGRAFAQFGPRMNEGLASPTSRASQALRALGIDVRDSAGNIRQLDEMLPELAERFGQFANGSNKAALAAALFGEEAGPKMLALLSRGKAGLEEIRRTLGSTYTAEDVERVRQYKLVVADLQVSFEKMTMELVRTFGPTLVAVSNAIAQALNSMCSAMPDQEIATITTRIQTIQNEIGRLNERLGRGRVDLEQYNLQMEQLNLRLANAKSRLHELQIGPFTTTVNLPQAPGMDPFKLEKAQMVLDGIMERLNGQRDIFDSINLSWEEHSRVVQQALDQIDKAHEQKHRQQHVRHRIEQGLRRQEQQGMIDTASEAARAISAIWPKQKGAAIAAAIINTAVGVTNALRQPGPPGWNMAQAALIAAAGAAQIAQIRSTNEDGSGGVSSPAPTAAAPEAQEAAPSRSLFIQGVDPAAFFSGRQVEELIRSINSEVQNGATLIATRNLPI
jgi:hypothetical protein